MKYKLCRLLLFLFLTVETTYGTSIDSLLSAASTQTGAIKAATLVQLSFQYKDVDPLLGTRQGFEAAALARKEKDPLTEGTAYTAIAVNFTNLGYYDSVVTYAMKARAIGEKYKIPVLIADSHNYIGLAFYFLGDGKQAIRFYEMALEFRKHDNNQDKLSKLYNNLAIAYSMEQDYQNSEKYTLLSLELKKKTGDYNSLARTYTNLASIYRKKKLYTLASSYLDTAYSLSVKYRYEGGTGIVYKSFARIYADQGQYSKAIEYTLKAAGIFEKLNDPRGKCETWIELAEYFRKDNQPGEAIKRLEEAVQLAKRFNFKVALTEAYIALFNIAKAQNDSETAIKYADMLIQQRDSLFTRSSYNNLLLKSIDYEIKLKDQEIRTLSEQQQLQELQNSRNFMIYLIIFIALGSLLITVLVIFYQKRASLRLVQDMINSVTDPFMLINASNSEILIRNKSKISDMFVKMKMSSILTPERLKRIKEEKNSFIEEVEFQSENGINYNFNLNFYPALSKGDEVEKIVLYAANITSLKNAEKTIKQYLQRLTRSEEELIKLNDSKDRLISILAHDLRNPFVLLINIADILIDEYYEMTEEEKFKLLKDSQRTAIATLQILENLLSWARTQSKSLTVIKEPLDLYNIVEGTILTVAPLAEVKSITIENAVQKNLPPVRFDKFMLDTILRNLVANSIKYTPGNGNIKIHAGLSSDNKISVRVCDTGTGISEDEIHRILNENSIKSKPGTDNEKGTGIGLIIIKNFLNINGSALKIESALGEGTCMMFDIYND